VDDSRYHPVPVSDIEDCCLRRLLIKLLGIVRHRARTSVDDDLSRSTNCHAHIGAPETRIAPIAILLCCSTVTVMQPIGYRQLPESNHPGRDR